jgi:hypothetical protein
MENRFLCVSALYTFEICVYSMKCERCSVETQCELENATKNSVALW